MEGLYDQFWSEVNKLPAPKNVTIDIDNNININRLALIEKIEQIDTMDEKQLYEMVKASYSAILNGIIANLNNASANNKYVKLMMEPKFIIALTQVVGSVELLHSEKVQCNRLAYRYLAGDDDQNEYTKQLFFSLSKAVNRRDIPALLGIGIPETLAAYMALARSSSEDEMVNVKRLNFIIMTSQKELMTEQMIVYIYERLFDRLTILFEATMLDVLPTEEWVTDDIAEVYSTMSLALLDLLESMRSADIGKVLRSYVEDYHTYYHGKPFRFSMTSLSADYQRIIDVIDMLKASNIFVM